MLQHSPTVVQAVVLLIGATGSACAMALSPLAQNAYLVHYYAALTASMGFTTAIFWFVFRSGNSQRGLAEPAPLQPPLKNTGPPSMAVLEPAAQLEPIVVGEAIKPPIVFMSRLSCSCFENQTIDTRHELPRRSSRRPRLSNNARNVNNGTEYDMQSLLKSRHAENQLGTYLKNYWKCNRQKYRKSKTAAQNTNTKSEYLPLLNFTYRSYCRIHPVL
jgi:hypothetical protein